MDIHIVDPLEKLSKNQKSKIRALYNEGKEKNEILDTIHYVDTNFRYKDFVEEKISEKAVKLTFQQSDNLEELRAKLRAKLQKKSTNRCNLYKNDAWKMYEQLVEQSKQRVADNAGNTIPNPDQVKQSAEMYKIMLQNMPNPVLKKYFDLCLSV
jgi:23S rRNA maturation-related 3'-5' exoribonuclease YhaM